MIVFDFDGTILRGNSFPWWIKNVLYSSFFNLKLSIFIRVSFWLFLRKVFGLSHVKLKSELCRISYPQIWDERLFKKMKSNINKAVLLDVINVRDKALISSAAPRLYLEGFIKYISIPESVEVHASQWSNGEFYDNCGSNKVLLLDLDDDIELLYTDHLDDVPLMELANKIALVGISRSDIPATLQRKVIKEFV